MTQAINPLSMMATAPLTSGTHGGTSKSGTWYQAMAEAWGQTLDRQAGEIETLADKIGAQGSDSPSTLTMMSAESLKMGFLSTSAHTALSSTGEALKTMAQKS